MDLGIQGRTAIVCASTAGLGEATARALGAEGAKVVVCGRRGGLAREIAGQLPEAIGVEVDLTRPEGPDKLVDAAQAAFGQVDILVTNGPGPQPGGASEIDGAAMSSAFDSLLFPPERLVRLLLPAMRQQQWGRIIGIASIGVVEPIPNLALSNVGRAALAAYFKTLAGEVAADGVTVNLLLPGRIATERTTQMTAFRAERAGVTVEQAAADVTSAIPVGRLGQPVEFGALAAFLCSVQASYITGTALRCDGGVGASL